MRRCGSEQQEKMTAVRRFVRLRVQVGSIAANVRWRTFAAHLQAIERQHCTMKLEREYARGSK